MVPTDFIYEELFGFKKPDAVNDNLEAEGFETTLFLFNVGSLIIAIISYPIMLVTYIVMKLLCCGKQSWVEKKRAKLGKLLFWTHPIVTIMESYAVLVMSVFINIRFMDYRDLEHRMSAVFTFIFAGIVFSAPLVFGLLLLKNWKILDKDHI